MGEPYVIRSFAGGELSPAIAARADLPKHRIGLRQCHNFIIERYGAAANRPGTRFVAELKTDSANIRLCKYISETSGQSVLIEHGPNYMRFYQNGQRVEVTHASVSAWSNAVNYVPGDLVTNGGVVYYCILAHINQAPPNATYWYPLTDASAGVAIYEIPTPFTTPRETNYVQSGRIVCFTHQSQRPHDLVFVSLTRWILVPLVTQPNVGTPTGLAVATVAGAENWAYKITAVAPLTFEESDATAEVRDTTSLAPTVAAPHLLTWTAVQVNGVNCPAYNIYCDKSGNGTFGYIGQAGGGQVNFQNPDITPDYNITPPASRDLFANASDRPAAAGYHQQRRFFGNTVNVPDANFASRIGFPDNFGVSLPLQDDDAIDFKIAGNNNYPVRFYVPLKDLLIFTDGGEWRFFSANGVLSPSAHQADQETYVGIAPHVAPEVVGNSVLYLQARQSIIRELRFSQDVEAFNGRDLTLFANHLFDGFTIVRMGYAQVPESILWVVRSDGTFLGLTYLHEQDVFAWHRHSSAALYRDVCVMPEATRDVPYFTEQYTKLVGGFPTNAHYLVFLEDRFLASAEGNASVGAASSRDVMFLDTALTYDGAPATVLSGLGHLEGTLVYALADFIVRGPFTVNASGQITLPVAASVVHVGTQITATFAPVRLDADASNVRERKKAIQSVSVTLLKSSRDFKYSHTGITGDFVAYVAGQYDEQPPELALAETLWSGNLDFTLKGAWKKDATVFIRMDNPLPIRVTAIAPSLEVGG